MQLFAQYDELSRVPAWYSALNAFPIRTSISNCKQHECLFSSVAFCRICGHSNKKTNTCWLFPLKYNLYAQRAAGLFLGKSAAGLQESPSEAIIELSRTSLKKKKKKLFKKEFTPASAPPALPLLHLDFRVLCSFATNFDEDAPAFGY